MAICGPKLSLCGVVLSIWGIIQLSIMGVFFYINRYRLTELGRKPDHPPVWP